MLSCSILYPSTSPVRNVPTVRFSLKLGTSNIWRSMFFFNVFLSLIVVSVSSLILSFMFLRWSITTIMSMSLALRGL